MKKKIVLIIIAAAVVAGGAYMFLNSGKITVSEETIKKGAFSDSFKETGIYTSGNTSDILSASDGNVLRVNVKLNSQVKQGDIIAVIDSTDYENQKGSHESTAKSYAAQADNQQKTEKYDKQDMSYSIKELKSELSNLESTRNKTDIENVTKSSPSVYVSTLEIEMNTAQNALTIAERNYNNSQVLFENGIISKTEFDDLKTEYDNASLTYSKSKSEYEASKNRLDTLIKSGKTEDEIDKEYFNASDVDVDKEIEKTQLQINALETKLNNDYSSSMAESYRALADSEQKQADILAKKIDSCSIKAPCDGIITALPVEKVSHIAEGDSIATIKTDDGFSIESNVLTTSEPYLKTGDSVNIVQKLKGGDTTYKGHINQIYDYAEKSTSALGIDEYRVKVKTELDDKTVKMKDGYEFEVEFFTYPASDNVISVPNSAIFKDGDVSCIFKTDGKKAVKTQVKTGHKGNSRTEILSGISDGDTIVVNANTQDLEDGVKIEAQ